MGSTALSASPCDFDTGLNFFPRPRVEQFKRPGRGGHVEQLAAGIHELAELERAVVEGRGQPEPVLDQYGFARPVALVHPANLGNRGVGFVDERQEFALEEIQQRVGSLARRAAGQMARVVLDALAKAHFPHHFQVVFGPLFDPLGFEELAFPLELLDPPGHLAADGRAGRAHAFDRSDELLGGIERVRVNRLAHRAGERIEVGNAVHLVAEKFHPDRRVFQIGGKNLDHIAARAESPALEGHVVALVQDLHQPAQEGVALEGHAPVHRHHHVLIIARRAQAVDAGNRGHDQHVLAGEQRTHGREPVALDLIVDGGILLDVRVGARDVGLGLVVVEIGNEILDRVVREEGLELGVQLRGQCLVVGNDQGRLADGGDDVRHGEGFAGACHTEQGLVAVAGLQRFEQLRDGLALIALRLVGGNKLEGIGHGGCARAMPKRAGYPFSRCPARPCCACAASALRLPTPCISVTSWPGSGRPSPSSFFPPRTAEGAAQLFEAIRELEAYKPSFVSVTYGAGGATPGFDPRSGAARSKEKPRLDPVPHLTCVCHSEADVAEILDRYAPRRRRQYPGPRRRPAAKPCRLRPRARRLPARRRPGALHRAIQCHGRHPARGFGIGVAGFPEGHPATPNRLKEMDYLKAKVDAGADYICTQLFFDNHDFYDFRDRCQLAGIHVPDHRGHHADHQPGGHGTHGGVGRRHEFPGQVAQSRTARRQ